jgi:hypothetical protein
MAGPRLLALALALASAAAPAAEDAALPSPRRVGPRLPGKEREEAFRKNGGTAETAKAVAAGLDWLERHALAAGGWDADGFPGRCAEGGKRCDGVGKGHHGEDAPCPFDGALSALAALAFLGDGVLPAKEGSPRERLLEATLRGLEGGGGDPWTAALATEALAEAEALERKGRWREAAARGAKALVAARGPDGGWGYIAGMRKGSDVPYTAFAVAALAAARDAGAEVPADLGAGVDRYLDSLEEKEGKLAYLVEGRAYGYTPTAYNAHAAAAIRETLGVGLEGRRHRAHVALVAGSRPRWEIAFREIDVPGRGRQRVQIGGLSEMNWWYGTMAMFRRGGAEWSGWWGSARTALLGHQRKDGCAKGSWDPEGQYERAVGGRILATALGVLILESPIRHVP